MDQNEENVRELCNGNFGVTEPNGGNIAVLSASSGWSSGWKEGTKVNNKKIGNISDYDESFECISKYRGLALRGDMWAEFENGKKRENLDGMGINQKRVTSDYVQFYDTRTFKRKKGWASQKVELKPEVYVYKASGNIYFSCYTRAYSTGSVSNVYLDAKIKRIDFIY
ncbi:hypothetical protein [Spiroplasma endosymbiont of Panorpa germanica]|uniref:hypothetical protein n=1 Tax=Spiroplasma endosymbiont of Panorpa germanica TaxID=3066314 RepID=UPI0030D5BCD9